jgi:2-polyprenyl-3-methyl-5-hydroxy-6-metoxy-1,4-benzoquinol methylase
MQGVDAPSKNRVGRFLAEDEMNGRHRYDYEVDPESDTAPARVCRMVGSHKRVLEIGAGPGSVTRVLRRQENHIVALELDPTAIPFLEPHCDKVVAANLDSVDWPSAFDGKFDAIIAADVLEHLIDPWTTLGRMKSLLAPGGVLVISVPHAAHACILACLLDEDVEYHDWGLLDRTHIRFFGFKNLHDMLAKAELKVVHGEFVVRAPSQTEFKAKWDALDKKAKAFLDKQRFAHVYQVVFMAAPLDDPRPAVDLFELDPSAFDQQPAAAPSASTIHTVASKVLRAITQRVGKR